MHLKLYSIFPLYKLLFPWYIDIKTSHMYIINPITWGLIHTKPIPWFDLILGSLLWSRNKRNRKINIGVSHPCEREPINPNVVTSTLVTNVGLWWPYVGVSDERLMPQTHSMKQELCTHSLIVCLLRLQRNKIHTKCGWHVDKFDVAISNQQVALCVLNLGMLVGAFAWCLTHTISNENIKHLRSIYKHPCKLITNITNNESQ